MRVHLFGVRGSIPTPGPDYARYGGNTSCVGIEVGDGSIPLVLDLGTGARLVGAALGERPFTGSVLLSHLHWDHIYGLPFFGAGDREDARVALHVPAPDDPVEALERPMSPPVFPISPRQLRGEWTFHRMVEGTHEIEGLVVEAREIPHKGGLTFGYRIDDGTHAVAYMSDHSPTSDGPGPHGLGAYHEAAMALARDVDLLIHDAQYTRAEFEVRKDWGHCSWDYPIELANAAGADRVLLFHHGPDHDDETLDRIGAGVPSHASLAVEGDRIDI